jgi:hypothetical protein
MGQIGEMQKIIDKYSSHLKLMMRSVVEFSQKYCNCKISLNNLHEIVGRKGSRRSSQY